MRARDFFESVRAAAEDAERTRHTLLRMEARELPRGMGTEPGAHGGSDSMGASDAVMDYEALIRRRVEEDWKLIDEACRVLYGTDQDGRGGVASLLGTTTADVMWWRFCAASKWVSVSDRTDVSVAKCKRLCNVACDAIDSLGFGAVVAGDGGADW